MTFVEQLREEGEQIGRIQAKIEVATNCLRLGLDIEQISRITKLSVEQINAIAHEHQIH